MPRPEFAFSSFIIFVFNSISAEIPVIPPGFIFILAVGKFVLGNL